MAMYRCGSNSGGVTPTSITPSNATPAAMSSGVIYETTAAGYAIASYDSKTPDDTTPPTVASGDIVKMGGAGYLYATQQGGGGETETTLWTNGSPTSSFGSQEVTLSGDYTNYKRLRLYYRASTTNTTEHYIDIPTAEYANWYVHGTTASTAQAQGCYAVYVSAWYIRQLRRGSSSTKFFIAEGGRVGNTGTSTTVGIPTKITGLN